MICTGAGRSRIAYAENFDDVEQRSRGLMMIDQLQEVKVTLAYMEYPGHLDILVDLA